MTDPRPKEDAMDHQPDHTDTDDSVIVRRARSRGMSDAGGPLDAWSFGRPGLLPYLAWLERDVERAVASLRSRLRDEVSRAALRARRAKEESAGTERRIAHLEALRDEAAEQEQIIRARIDELAAADQRRRRRREHPGGHDPETAGSPREGAGPTVEKDRPDDVPPAAPDPLRPAAASRWEGPYSPAPLSRWLKVTVLVVLMLVDIPIQWVIFQHFHADNPLGGLLTVAVTLSVAAVMVLLPHFAGHLYRGRHVTGTERLVAPLTFVLLVPGLYLVGILGYLRARILLVPPTNPENGKPLVGADGHVLKSNAEPLHASDWSIIVMFVALLFITGGIAYLVGTARIHPLQQAYRGAAEERDRREREAEELRPVVAELAARQRHEQNLYDDLAASLDERIRAEEEVTRLAYASAALAYVDGAIEAFADATVTEAATRYLAERDGAGPATAREGDDFR
jgi:hypothetical protein